MRLSGLRRFAWRLVGVWVTGRSGEFNGLLPADIATTRVVVTGERED
jgi:hypothetical protein